MGDEKKQRLLPAVTSWSAVGSHGQYRPQAVCGRYVVRGFESDELRAKDLLRITDNE
jgi:hypothetical protein